MDIDPNANAYQRPAPIPDAPYVAQLAVRPTTGGKFDKPILQGGQDKNGDAYFFGNFDVKIIEPATDQVPAQALQGKAKTLRGRVTTFETTDQKGLHSNEMAHVAIAAGAVPSGNQLGEIGYAFMQAVQAGAKIGVLTEWQVSKKNAKGFYDVVKRGMASFPKNLTTNPATGEEEWDGTYNPTVTIDGVELTARAEVKSYFRL